MEEIHFLLGRGLATSVREEVLVLEVVPVSTGVGGGMQKVRANRLDVEVQKEPANTVWKLALILLGRLVPSVQSAIVVCFALEAVSP